MPMPFTAEYHRERREYSGDPMNDTRKIQRRTFLQLVAAAVGGASLFGGCKPSPPSTWTALSDDEGRLLAALADQIIPPDEWPGGAESGCVHYIDTQLAGPYKRYIEDYHKGLAAIQQSCHSRYQHAFEEIPSADQTAFLHSLESGSLNDPAWSNGFDKRFFELIRNHCLQGFYGSPRHGGNKDYVSYRMMGLDYPPVIGQNRYRT
jgi:gluconate 2-dehydrogenase gamma chain